MSLVLSLSLSLWSSLSLSKWSWSPDRLYRLTRLRKLCIRLPGGNLIALLLFFLVLLTWPSFFLPGGIFFTWRNFSHLAEFHDGIPDKTSSSSCRGVQESNVKLEMIVGRYPRYCCKILPCPLWKISTGQTLEKLGREGHWFHHLARTLESCLWST